MSFEAFLFRCLAYGNFDDTNRQSSSIRHFQYRSIWAATPKPQFLLEVPLQRKTEHEHNNNVYSVLGFRVGNRQNKIKKIAYIGFNYRTYAVQI